MIDGYTRFQAFRKVVLPQMLSGIAATAIFCLIFAWNEYAFALLLTSSRAQTAPPFIPTIIGGGLDWPAWEPARRCSDSGRVFHHSPAQKSPARDYLWSAEKVIRHEA